MRIVMVSIWICVVLVGALLAARAFSTGVREPAIEGPTEALELETVSVPVVRRGKVEGYVVARFTYMIETADNHGAIAHLDLLIAAGTFAFLYDRRGEDIFLPGNRSLRAIVDNMRDRLNASLPDPVIREILVLQYDYLSKDEIRDLQIRRAYQ